MAWTDENKFKTGITAMCGIVGIFDLREKREINQDLLSRMNESQYHRGPDEGGLHIEAGLGFGHRRLSIIDNRQFACLCVCYLLRFT